MAKNKKAKVFVMMSGGVDSSVAALLLKKRGYQLTGCFIKGYNLDGCAEKDAEDARRVAEHLGIPFYVFNLEREYKEKVVDYLIKGYREGITPNPDVMCNKEIKFGLFLEKALSLGTDYVATGHYVRREPEFPIINDQFSNNIKRIKNSKIENSLKIENCKLKIAKDMNKDQSYFLWTLTQKQLRHCLFPIGDYLKSEVREIARKAGLPTAEKKDSQGICFLGQINLKDFLKQNLPEKRGKILDLKGNEVGWHNGAYFYTVGQRHLKTQIRNPRLYQGFGGQAKSEVRKEKKPYYVADKDVKRNILIVAEGEDNPALFKKEIRLAEVNFINQKIYSQILKNIRIDILARVRYRQPLSPAILIFANKKEAEIKGSPLKSASSPPRSATLVFKQAQKFVAPGQSAVFYSKKGELLGGGIIL